MKQYNCNRNQDDYKNSITWHLIVIVITKKNAIYTSLIFSRLFAFKVVVNDQVSVCWSNLLPVSLLLLVFNSNSLDKSIKF